MWVKQLNSLNLVREIRNLPHFALQFFFTNMGGFKVLFWLLTLNRVFATLLKFYAYYLLSQLISNINSINQDDIVFYYLPVFVTSIALKELLDYFIRKYGEAFPQVYCDHLRLRIFKTILAVPYHKLFNYSKERLLELFSRYINHLNSFLSDWFWNTSTRATEFVIVLCILFYQSKIVFFINLTYMLVFLAVALRISGKFSTYARRYAEQSLESNSTLASLLLQLNTLKRLNLSNFFERKYCNYMSLTWGELERVRDFHAKRWFLQLNLFNLIYVGTLFFGVYQIKQNKLELGFLVLIKYAFDQLWYILVYIIEYYVSLVSQKQDTLLIQREIAELIPDSAITRSEVNALESWHTLALKNIHTELDDKKLKRLFVLDIPHFEIKRGDKVGFIGPSGAGKTSILNILLGLIPYQGDIELDGVSISKNSALLEKIVVITNYDPLFPLTLHENILLGELEPSNLLEVLKGLKIDFAENLNHKLGSANINLSLGQEQRLRLARGLIKDAEIYLFDDPFTGIDPSSKLEIIQFIKDYLKDKTILLITHQRDELILTERCYEVRDGSIS